MSLTGNINYSQQNLENSNPLTDNYDLLNARVTNNEEDIITNTNNISSNAVDIAQLEIDCTDISYDSATDTTTINNRLKLANRLDWYIGNGVNIPPRLQIDNTSPDINNQYSTYIYTGSEHQANLASKIATEGDTVIINRR